MSGNKSRSIHNLAGNNASSINNDQGFYQNLSVYRAQNQSQPNLGDPRLQHQQQQHPHSQQHQSGPLIQNPSMQQPTLATNPQQQQHHQMQQQQQQILSRPASAYFNNSNNSNTLPSSSSYPNNNLSNNNSNISSSISNSNISMQSGPVGQQHNNANATMRGKQSFPGQGRMQMMAPSMPNIAHSSGYATNISSSQSMQNVNMIPGNYPGGGGGNMGYQQQQDMQQQQQQQQMQQRQQAALLRGQAKLAEMGEELKRRHMRQEQQLLPNQPVNTGNSIDNMMLNQKMNQQFIAGGYPNNQQMSPVKQLPPTAPKPHRLMSNQEDQPPLPPTQTHPLFKPGQQPQSSGNMNYSASAGEPPKGAYYPVAQSKNIVGGSSNPWEREEREKESEMRREHLRQWRDQQIAELATLSHRTPQQEEQYRSLILDRDFERRALETDEQEDDMESLPKESEIIRTNQLQPPMTNMKQVDVKVNTVPINDNASESSYTSQQPSIASSTVASASIVQPKSILKHNTNRIDSTSNATTPSSPSKHNKSATFADDRNYNQHQESTTSSSPPTQMINQLTKEMNNMNMIDYDQQIPPPIAHDNYHNHHAHHLQNHQLPPPPLFDNQSSSGGPPPPPPERNSSYVVMSQKQQTLRHSTTNNLPSKPIISDTQHQQQQPAPPQQYQSQSQQHQQMNSNYMMNKRTSNVNNNTSINNNNNNQIIPPPSMHIISSTSLTTNVVSSSGNINANAMLANRQQQMQDKRVSFHDEENNLISNQNHDMLNTLDHHVHGGGIDITRVNEDPNVSNMFYLMS